MVHWDPDISRIPCMGCDEMIDPRDLVRYADRRARSGPLWHPYHFWCIRYAPPAARPFDRCADCGAAIDLHDTLAALRFGSLLDVRIGGYRRDPDNPPVRPAGLRLVAVRPRPDERLPRNALLLSEAHPDHLREDYLDGRWEIVHDDCGGDPEGWRAQLATTPDDADLRAVYADWLEHAGLVVQAELVRLSRDDDTRRRQLREQLPSWFVRAICRRPI